MKKIIVLSLLVFLIGCDQVKEKILDDEKYFICINIKSKVNPPLESSLIISKNKKTAEFMNFPYINLKEKSESLITVDSKVDNSILSFNRVTGELILDASGSYYYYECKETEPLM